MFVFAVLVLLGTLLKASSENHSLTYIYTGLSKPVGLPGIHEFTAMGLLDDKMIDYFDSENQAKIPKQEWMKTCVPENYWKEGTQSRKNKLQWFKESINILMQQMGQNDSVLHVLQWMVGCEVEMQPGGKLKFLQGFWKYNYDGDDFLYLDNKGQEWGAVNYVAELTKRKWDHYWNAKGYTKNYLENTCIDWLSNLLNCGQQQLRNTSAPEVYAIKKEAKVKTNITLICLVTGFYQKDIIMRIKRNEYILTEKDGLISSGVVPNGDETSQRSDHVEVLKSNLSLYTCEVIHEASQLNVKVIWDISVFNGNKAHIMVPTIAIIAIVIIFVCYCKRPICGGSSTAATSGPIPPKVFLYKTKSQVETKLTLVCVANGFYPDVITMRIKKRGQILTEKEGLQSTGVFKNDDEAFEIKIEVEVLKSDLSMYSCEVIHSAKKIIKFWGNNTDDESTHLINRMTDRTRL
ncbi:H-2 class I histocompatibility antigen, Q10 alpha chain-like [Neolamprologus brichardi]|uniref:H-2 class I histocompatibility antigen, Q10 alpha chain-like n=1 Tax=Neolamprologus brichardi TaxID=32507 RepID=UPI0003EC6103|nr:H-2 class I histocompatibility antigen, Q10 alpha chain-like [Neolamprologus brichardi]